MVESNDLRQQLDKYNGRPFGLVPGAFCYRTKTPRHEFGVYLLPIPSAARCLVSVCRDFFDESLAASGLQFVSKRVEELDGGKAILIFNDFVHFGYGFDAVGVISPNAARQFASENPQLSERTFVCFPMFRCEFVGDEDAATVSQMRHDIVPTLNWTRDASPVVRMRFVNAATGVRSTAPGLGITSVDFMFTQLQQMGGAFGSFMEIENYERIRCTISVQGEGFWISGGHDRDGILVGDYIELRDWLRQFLCAEYRNGHSS